MSTRTITSPSRSAVSEMAKVSIVAALYVAVTLLFAVVSFGAVQIRLSEMFNYLALFNKRYVAAITIGVIIANFMSPTWILDVPIGGAATFLVLLLSRLATRHIQRLWLKFAVTAVIFACSMFTVAGQLTIMHGAPFFITWVTVAAGELASMAVGGFLIYAVQKKMDLSK